MYTCDEFLMNSIHLTASNFKEPNDPKLFCYQNQSVNSQEIKSNRDTPYCENRKSNLPQNICNNCLVFNCYYIRTIIIQYIIIIINSLQSVVIVDCVLCCMFI